MHLAAPSQHVTRVLEITGTDKIFPTHSGIDDAVTVLAQQPSTPNFPASARFQDG